MALELVALLAAALGSDAGAGCLIGAALGSVVGVPCERL